MVMLYTSSVCTSCIKAKQWLKENNISHEERDIFAEPLSEREFKELLKKTKIGVEEVISVRSKVFKELNIEVGSLSLHELYKIIERYPSVLRRPIIIDDKNLQVGYNEEAMHLFYHVMRV